MKLPTSLKRHRSFRSPLKMWKGRTHHEWSRILIEAGWPPEVAGALAMWVTGMGPLPHWPPDHEIVRRIVPGD